MASGLITKRAVDAFQEAGQAVLWDTKLKGFGLLVTAAGTRSYIFQFRIGGRAGKLRRYTIGRHGSPWTPDSARKRAEDLSELVRKGIDPIEAERAEIAAIEEAKRAKQIQQQRNNDLRLATYAAKFIEKGLQPGTRDRTAAGYRSTLDNHIIPVIGEKPIPEITRPDIVRVMDRIPPGRPAVKRITFAVMRLLFKWAKDRGDIDTSPLDGMNAPKSPVSRDRVLTDEELVLAIRACGSMSQPFAAFYALLFATGQRREEVAGLQWKELDRETATWTLPGERAKNHEPHVIPLNKHAIAALDRLVKQEGEKGPKWPRKGLVLTTTGETAISGYSRAKTRLDAKMLELARKDAEKAGEDPEGITLEPWRLHDARRTLATALQRLGVRFEVTEAVLNHVSGASRSGVAGVYQRHNWADEKRAALNAWADFSDRLLAPVEDDSNVVPLKKVRVSRGRAR